MTGLLRRLDNAVAIVEMAVIVVGLTIMVVAYFLLVVLRYSDTIGTPLLVGGVISVVAGLAWFRWATVETLISVYGLFFGGLCAIGLGWLARNSVSAPWADELCRFMLMQVGFSGASLATKHAAHLSIDVADKVLKGTLRNIVGGLAMWIASAFAGSLVWVTLRYVLIKHEHGALSLSMQVPEWIPIVILPVAFTIMSLRFAGLGVARFRGEDVKRDEAAEAIAVHEEMSSGGSR